MGRIRTAYESEIKGLSKKLVYIKRKLIRNRNLISNHEFQTLNIMLEGIMKRVNYLDRNRLFKYNK